MPLKPFSAIAFFFDYYKDKEHKQYLDYLSHIIPTLYYEKSTSKELSFFPEMLAVLSVEDLFKFIEFFPDCRIGIPNIKKLAYTRDVAYAYYLVKIKNEFDIWNYNEGDMKEPLGEKYSNEQERIKLLEKVESLVPFVEESKEITSYFIELDNSNDSFFQTNLFIISTFFFYELFYDRQKKIVNFFPDIINFYGFDLVQQILRKYQSSGNLIILKTPSLEVLRYLVTTIISYYFYYYLDIEWIKIKSIIPFYISKPKKILSNIKRMKERIDLELVSMKHAK